ncbi:MAG: aminotransferase class III-fold pyridoxal phosphate-dependent enzyme, partial [Acidobacteria bacterium]|nr:aminotransferase class III-fold pyridoxal phosphate-dependent enzyme [Acidobacteriota bacterium]
MEPPRQKHEHPPRAAAAGEAASPEAETCRFKSKAVYGPQGKTVRYVCEQVGREEILRRATAYLDLIRGAPLEEVDRKHLTSLTVANFENFFNRGYLEYRKSVTEAEDYAALEWEGEGSIVRDLRGREYIDFLGGFGIYNCGIKHPAVVEAVAAQLRRMPLSSQELLDPLRAGLAEMLGELAPGDLQDSFFINNGTDAVEGAMKLARLASGKPGFVATLKGFHGKSMGSLSLMGKGVYRKPFEPLLDNVYFVPFGDAEALEHELGKQKSLGREIAAFVVEPVQGEAGAIVPPDDYFPKVREICDEYGVLLVLDEVQTGFGRTGKIFACEHWGVVPDILCLGKAIGGGVMPLSAFISSQRVWKVLEKNPFLHSSTFGGNPMACAAGIAFLKVLLTERLDQQAQAKGDYILKGLAELQKDYPEFLSEVRGKGLL